MEIKDSLVTLGESWRWAEEDVFIILAVHLEDRGKKQCFDLQAAHPWARKETLKALGDLELEEGRESRGRSDDATGMEGTCFADGKQHRHVWGNCRAM